MSLEYKIHPAANLFPLMEGDELAALVADIKANGLLNPIVMSGGVVLDGRNRLRACDQAEVKPVFAEWTGTGDPLPWIISQNLHRRHLDEGQRAMVAARVKPMFEEDARKRQEATRAQPGEQVGQAPANLPEREDRGEAREKAATLLNVSPRSVQSAQAVIHRADPALVAAVDAGKVAVSAAAKLVDAPVAVQQAVARGDVSPGAAVARIRHETAQAAVVKQAGPPVYVATITLGESGDWLKTIPLASADLLLTDPPFMTDVDDVGAFAALWVPEALARVKDTGRAYICTGSYPDEIAAYVAACHRQDRFTLSDILVWTYRNTLGPSPTMGYKRNWQAVFHLHGPDAPPLDCPIMTEQFSVQDINAPDGRLGDRYHAWQKPDELGERFIRHATKAGDLVIDPFTGTGTFLLAAARLGRQARGCDSDPCMIHLATERGCRLAD